MGRLLQAVGTLLEGAPRAERSWEEEPGEYRWIFEVEGNWVRIRILPFDSVRSPRPEGEGQQVFVTSGSLHDVANAISEGAANVLAEYGEDEYLRWWVNHPFPMGLLQMVERLLAQGGPDSPEDETPTPAL